MAQRPALATLLGVIDPPPTRRLGCLGWSLIVLGFVAVVVLVLALWLRSDVDLDAERARAAAMGLPQTWEGLGLVRPPPADVDILERLGMAARRGVEYAGNGAWESRWDPFLPPPADLATWDSGVDADVDGLIDQLSGQPAWAVDADAADQAMRNHHTGRLATAMGYPMDDPHELVGDHLGLRSLRGRDQPDRLAERMARLASTPSGCWLANHSDALSLANELTSHVLRHRAAIDPGRTATLLIQVADRLDRVLGTTIAAQPLIQDALLRQDPESLFRTLNVRRPALMTIPLCRAMLFRIGRRPIVARANDAAAWVSAHGIPQTWSDRQSTAPDLPRPGYLQIPQMALTYTLEYPETRLSYHPTISNLPHLVHYHLLVVTSLRLLAADLAGTTWPADPCDPHGLPLRPVLRDGLVIGAYGCSPDGIDQGGNRRADWCFPLRALLGKPMAGDPLPKP